MPLSPRVWCATAARTRLRSFRDGPRRPRARCSRQPDFSSQEESAAKPVGLNFLEHSERPAQAPQGREGGQTALPKTIGSDQRGEPCCVSSRVLTRPLMQHGSPNSSTAQKFLQVPKKRAVLLRWATSPMASTNRTAKWPIVEQIMGQSCCVFSQRAYLAFFQGVAPLRDLGIASASSMTRIESARALLRKRAVSLGKILWSFIARGFHVLPALTIRILIRVIGRLRDVCVE
jgi:hypothetical protein